MFEVGLFPVPSEVFRFLFELGLCPCLSFVFGAGARLEVGEDATGGLEWCFGETWLQG
jgi:hypothetical protein